MSTSRENYFSRLKTLFLAGGHGWRVQARSELPHTILSPPGQESSQKKASMFFRMTLLTTEKPS
jgi:hypothetical protein